MVGLLISIGCTRSRQAWMNRHLQTSVLILYRLKSPLSSGVATVPSSPTSAIECGNTLKIFETVLAVDEDFLEKL